MMKRVRENWAVWLGVGTILFAVGVVTLNLVGATSTIRHSQTP